MSVQEVVKQPWSPRHIGGKVYNACKCAGGGGGGFFTQKGPSF